MNKNVFITIKKELRSIFRDKKSILRMFLFPLIIPAMIIFYGEIYKATSGEETYYIGVNYETSAPEQEILANLNIEHKKYENEESLKEAFDENEISGYITYDKESNTYKIFTDSSSTTGMNVNYYAEEYLKNYSTYLTNIYLQERNILLDEAYNHFNIDYQELNEGSNNYMLTCVLSVSFTYIIMAICMSTSSMAIGVTATERENGTLETILTFPINKKDLIVGKYLAAFIIGLISSLIGLILTIVSILFAKNNYTMLADYELVLSFKTILISLIVIISASLFVAGAALTLTCFSKTYKEAQSSVGMLNMVCIIPMIVSIVEMELSKIYYIIPICNYEQILMDVFTNNINIVNALLALCSTIIYISIIIVYITKSYNSEKILFAK